MATRKGSNTNKPEGESSIHRRGEGLGTGRVGQGTGRPGSNGSTQRPNGNGSVNRPRPNNTSSQGNGEKGLMDLITGTTSSGSTSSSGGNGGKRGGLMSIIGLIVGALVIFFVLRTFGCFGGNGGGGTDIIPTQNNSSSNILQAVTGSGLNSVLSGMGLSDVVSGSGLGSFDSLSSGTPTGNTSSWGSDKNTGKLDTTVASGSRKKFTTIKGNGKDTVTIMVYMCGTDLESKYGMATNDLLEMAKATESSKVRIIVYTGGCAQWKNEVFSNQVNQIYQVTQGGVQCLSKDEGRKSMTDPSTLSGFIQFCKKNFSADRYDLIFWDHGGGAVSGYGHDEKYPTSGSMSLAGIDTALRDGGVKFDFVGFDACLMATAENAQMLTEYADYMIASEESEPGVGWYYTNWLSELANNTSMPTVEIGKRICDDFVKECASSARGQATTLSVVDLAEFEHTVVKAFDSFAQSTASLIASDYQTVSRARSGSREFGAASKIDMCDLVHFTKKLDTKESNALAKALLGAIKYNQTSSDMANSYGLSVYFPNRSKSFVSQAASVYDKIGISDAYTKCIKSFATTSTAGQATNQNALLNMVSGGSQTGTSGLSTTDLVFSLLGGGSNSSTQSSTSGALGLLSGLLGSGTSTSGASNLSAIGSLISTLSGRDLSFLDDRSIPTEQLADYVAKNSLDAASLNFKGEDGDTLYIELTKNEWKLVNGLALSLYYYDGESYADLGIDEQFAFDKDGKLLALDDISWLTVNGQLVAYYYEGTTVDENGNEVIYGYIPAIVNRELDSKGELVQLMVAFDKTHPQGQILGARLNYDGTDIEVVAKNLITLEDGDTIDFVTDFYTEDGVYEETYMIGETITVNGELKLGKKKIESGRGNMMYRFTDIYGTEFWSECWINE